MKQIPSLITLALIGAALLQSGCSTSKAPSHPTASRPIPVVLDTDIGSDMDDTWALAELLRSPELDLKLVLCDTGDTEYRARVAAKFLQTAGRTDVPVGLGLPGRAVYENQLPWVEDYALTNYPGVIQRDGIDAFIKLVHASAEPVTLIAIGPVPNIAEALRRDPSIAPRVRFVGMQGSIDLGYGGSKTPAAEANVAGNPAAFRTVLAAPWADMEITPLDTCGLVVLGGTNYQRLRASSDPVIEAVLENFRIWSKLVTWTKVDYLERHSSTLYDTVAVYMAADGSQLEFESVPISVTDKGMTIRDPDHGRLVRCAMHWKNLDAFYDELTARLIGNAPLSSPGTGPKE